MAALLAGGAPSATDTQSHTFALPPGRSVAVEITVGDVRIRGESRRDALLEIVRTAPAPDGLARIPVTIDETPAGVRIQAAQIDGATNPAYRTDVMLRVPADAAVHPIRVLEGKVTIEGLRGTVDANVRRGTIEATNLQGVVRLETGMGDIVANRMRLTPSGLLRLRTFNGDVRLTLAARPQDARVMALVLNGSISSDIPLTSKDKWGPRWGEATLGRGEPVIAIDVVTGTITIHSP